MKLKFKGSKSTDILSFYACYIILFANLDIRACVASNCCAHFFISMPPCWASVDDLVISCLTQPMPPCRGQAQGNSQDYNPAIGPTQGTTVESWFGSETLNGGRPRLENTMNRWWNLKESKYTNILNFHTCYIISFANLDIEACVVSTISMCRFFHLACYNFL